MGLSLDPRLGGGGGSWRLGPLVWAALGGGLGPNRPGWLVGGALLLGLRLGRVGAAAKPVEAIPTGFRLPLSIQPAGFTGGFEAAGGVVPLPHKKKGLRSNNRQYGS